MNFHRPARVPRLLRAVSAGRMAAQRGFTLVELISVILILGVLAAVALPRYADLQGKARAAKVNAVLGSMRAASSLVKATALTGNLPCTAPSLTSVTAPPAPTLEGVSIAINYCYPQALASFTDGILAAAQVPASDGWAVDGTNVGGGTGGDVLQINLSGAVAPATCSVRYTSSVDPTTPPTITVLSGGC